METRTWKAILEEFDAALEPLPGTRSTASAYETWANRKVSCTEFRKRISFENYKPSKEGLCFQGT